MSTWFQKNMWSEPHNNHELLQGRQGPAGIVMGGQGCVWARALRQTEHVECDLAATCVGASVCAWQPRGMAHHTFVHGECQCLESLLVAGARVKLGCPQLG